jgi:hypothetical protein
MALQTLYGTAVTLYGTAENLWALQTLYGNTVTLYGTADTLWHCSDTLWHCRLFMALQKIYGLCRQFMELQWHFMGLQ